jgi:hypothetical protein
LLLFDFRLPERLLSFPRCAFQRRRVREQFPGDGLSRLGRRRARALFQRRTGHRGDAHARGILRAWNEQPSAGVQDVGLLGNQRDVLVLVVGIVLVGVRLVRVEKPLHLRVPERQGVVVRGGVAGDGRRRRLGDAIIIVSFVGFAETPEEGRLNRSRDFVVVGCVIRAGGVVLVVIPRTVVVVVVV